jgi:FtsZ-interacting cell division protein ZipA
MDTLAIILIVVAVVVAALLVGGLVVTRRRSEAGAADYSRHVAAADRALEDARAADRGWDRSALERTAQSALAQTRPDFSYEDLHLVLVDDRPGIAEDRAQFAAVGQDGEARVVLVRGPNGWSAESVG